MKKSLLFALTLAACGRGSGDAPKASSAPVKADPTGANSPETEPCIGTLAHKVPSPEWTQVGKLVFTFDGDRPKHVDTLALGGKPVFSDDLPADPKLARQIVSDAICKAGAVLAVLPSDKPMVATTTLPLYRSTDPDATHDVARLCRAPDHELPASLDASQKVRIGIEVNKERLATPHWRYWLFELDTDLSGPPDATTEATRKRRALELRAAVQKLYLSPCWLLDALDGH